MKESSLLKGNAIFEKYIRKNFIKYIIILVVYLIGFILGLMIFNNKIKIEENAMSIQQYTTDKIESIGQNITQSISDYIKQDFLELFILSVLSVSIVGTPIIIIWLFYDSLSLGITISAIIHTSGVGEGISFSIIVFMIPTIIKVFSLLLMVCSSVKLLENIMKYKKEFKYEIIRHAIVNLIVFFAFCAMAIYRSFSLNLINQILF